VAAALLLVTVVWLLSSPRCLFGPQNEVSAAVSAPAGASEAARAAVPAETVPEVPASPVPVVQGAVQPGDTASDLLETWLGPAQVHALAQVCRPVYSLARLRAGNPYAVWADEAGLARFEYEIDADHRLVAERADGDSASGSASAFTARLEPIVYDVRQATAQGTIDENLFLAVENAGEDPALAMMLYRVFAWEIDFIRGLRKGDTFRVLFEKRYRDGSLAGYGRILAAEFVNDGRHYRGFRFEQADGEAEFYDENGRNLRKCFLRAPLSFTRISSKFSRSRLHPILKVRRPHPGIDYAAPTGTPVKAVADGTVVKVARSHGAGNYVTLRHLGGYETSYLHLSRYARGLRRGARVGQGTVIGYVGSTGLATGPHLDFRMKRNGAWVNPAAIKNPRAAALPAADMARFRAAIRPFAATLGIGLTAVAAGD
jgi:murein DD-endopeptidase MepM/ murein hydrolase activator NlpD